MLLDLVHALPHDHVLAEVDPRQRALHLHLPEVNPIAQALERGGLGEQQQVIAKVEKASFAHALPLLMCHGQGTPGFMRCGLETFDSRQ